MNLSSVSVAGATRRPRWQKVDGVERATGPFWRATRPTAERVRRYGIAERFARKTRRQVAAEDGQVGRATRNKGTHFGRFMGSRRDVSGNSQPCPSALRRARESRLERDGKLRNEANRQDVGK